MSVTLFGFSIWDGTKITRNIRHGEFWLGVTFIFSAFVCLHSLFGIVTVRFGCLCWEGREGRRNTAWQGLG